MDYRGRGCSTSAEMATKIAAHLAHAYLERTGTSEGVHKLVSKEFAIGTFGTTVLVVVVNLVGALVRTVDDERHGVIAMRTGATEGRVVRKDGNGDRVVTLHLLDGFPDRSHDTIFEIFDGTCLEFRIASMSRFVGGFDMKEDEVIFFERINGGLRLAFIVSVPKTGCTWHIDDLQARIDADALDEVNRGDDRTIAESVSVKQRVHVRSIAR